MNGHFVVKDKKGKFNCVSPDMKLGQTIQRAVKDVSGIGGVTEEVALRCRVESHLTMKFT